MVQEISCPLARRPGNVHSDTLSCATALPLRWPATRAREDAGNPFFAIQFPFLPPKRAAPLDMTRALALGARSHSTQGTPDNVVTHGREIDPLPDQTPGGAAATWLLGKRAKITIFRVVLGNRRTTSVRTSWTPVRLAGEHWRLVHFIHDPSRRPPIRRTERLRARAHLRIGRLLAAHTPGERKRNLRIVISSTAAPP